MASTPPKNFFERWLGVIAAVLGVVSTVLTIWTGYLASRVNQLNQQLSTMNAERDWTGKIVDRLSTVVTNKDLPPEQRIAAIAPLANLVPLVGNKEVHDGLVLSIKRQIDVYQKEVEAKSQEKAGDAAAVAQSDAVIRQAATIAETVGKPVQAAAAPKAQAYNFDIFWCESTPGGAALANRINGLRTSMPAPIGRWRVRMLADATNARQGYRKRGFIINYNSSDEVPFAQKLQDLIAGDGTLASNLPPVRILPVSMNTPGYLSVFVCPA